MAIRASMALFLVLAATASADEKLKGVACRSVHLGFTAEPGTAFYNEVQVEESAPGTYFCAIGFNAGYFGIQELDKGKKLAIFSVWDPTPGDDPKKVPVEKRVIERHKGEGVRTGRFGGEGTGGQSFFEYEWKKGEKYRFLVTAAPDTDDEDRTAYSGYFYIPEKKDWKHLVTFSTLAPKKTLSGYYSFVEDFKRDKVSATKVRKAEFGNAWAKVGKEWKPVTEARFTGDSNPVENIDAGPLKASGRFFLATGGDTKNENSKLKEKMTHKSSDDRKAPDDLPIK